MFDGLLSYPKVLGAVEMGELITLPSLGSGLKCSPPLQQGLLHMAWDREGTLKNGEEIPAYSESKDKKIF